MVIDLNVIWFVLIGILFTGYAVLDGFDLGVGSLHFIAKSDEDRRMLLNSIGPVWDGNEVWLITGGGALFAAFPVVYAAVFSGFYLAFILLLFGFIFRAVAIEFRSKQPMKWWRNIWDISFSISSILIGFLIGVALGNIVRGIPLDPTGEFLGTFWSLLNPYALLVGIMTIVLFAMHGSIYLLQKTEGALKDRIEKWAKGSIMLFVVFHVMTTVMTMIFIPHMIKIFRTHPWLFIIPFLNILVILNVYRELNRGKFARAFISSCAAMVLLMIIFGLGMFPNLVWSSPDPANSLTIYNASSSHKTLKIMLTIAMVGMPIVIAYTAYIYWVFRGKIKLDPTSY